jgi:hypothetical protein
MADKLKAGLNVLTSFVAGETPTAAKLNSITAQLKNASQQLEKALGDIRDQSYPYSAATAARLSAEYGRTDSAALGAAETRTLDIANVARLIGPASALNPIVLPGSLTVTEAVPAGVNEFALEWMPEDPTALTFSVSGSGSAFHTRQSDPADLSAAGHYYVDAYGRIYCTRATHATSPGTVTYEINRESWFGGPGYEGSTYNVLPDPNQLASGGAGVSFGSVDSQGRYPATLPVATYAQFNTAMGSIALSSADPNYNEQLKLPLVLTENYTAGDFIPEGFILLKNFSTGEVYDQAEYTYNNSTSVLVGNVDLTDAISRGDKFYFVTVGTDITTSIDDLRRKMRHGHERRFGEPLVPAYALSEWTKGPWGSEGSFVVSSIAGNHAPQYLHRYGYQSSENDWNDNNIMRGDIVLGVSGQSPGSYLGASTGSLAGSTYKIAFGHPNRNYIHENQSLGFFSMYAGVSDIQIRSASGDVNLVSSIDTTVNAGDRFLVDAAGEIEFLSTGTNKWDVDDDGRLEIRVADGGTVNSGQIRITSAGFYYTYDSSSTVTGMSTSAVDSNHHFVVAATQTSDTGHAGISLRNTTDAFGILNIGTTGTNQPAVGYRYIQFTDSHSARGEVGSIRSSGSSHNNAFYAVDSSSSNIAVNGIGSDITTYDAGDIRFVSGNADYGEYLLTGEDSWEPYDCSKVGKLGLPEGQIVFVREGRFYRSGPGTPMVVTNRAIIEGNSAAELVGAWEVLSFIGQVPVICIGSVQSGDYLIPSEAIPGVAVAISSEEISFQQYKKVIGTAWESAEVGEGQLCRVLCAIGIK